jgi:hypothetical protein
MIDVGILDMEIYIEGKGYGQIPKVLSRSFCGRKVAAYRKDL